MTSRVSGRRACKAANASSSRSKRFCGSRRPTAPSTIWRGSKPSARADLALAGAIARELPMVDAVEDGGDASGIRAVADELARQSRSTPRSAAGTARARACRRGSSTAARAVEWPVQPCTVDSAATPVDCASSSASRLVL